MSIIKKEILQFGGMAMGLTAMVSAWLCYDWKLAAILFFALWGNNMEQNSRK